MKEMLKSKVMVLFMVFMLGMFYLDAQNTKKLENSSKQEELKMVAINLK